MARLTMTHPYFGIMLGLANQLVRDPHDIGLTGVVFAKVAFFLAVVMFFYAGYKTSINGFAISRNLRLDGKRAEWVANAFYFVGLILGITIICFDSEVVEFIDYIAPR